MQKEPTEVCSCINSLTGQEISFLADLWQVTMMFLELRELNETQGNQNISCVVFGLCQGHSGGLGFGSKKDKNLISNSNYINSLHKLL